MTGSPNPDFGRYQRGSVVYLDPVKVRQARIRHGWSEHTVSGALGVADAVIHRIERGVDQKFLTFAFVRALAALLGETFDELIKPQSVAVLEAGAPDTVEPGDAAVVGAALARLQSAAQIDILAGALDWTLERTLIALEHLEALLEPTGQRLAWHHDSHVQLTPNAAPTP